MCIRDSFDDRHQWPLRPGLEYRDVVSYGIEIDDDLSSVQPGCVHLGQFDTAAEMIAEPEPMAARLN